MVAKKRAASSSKQNDSSQDEYQGGDSGDSSFSDHEEPTVSAKPSLKKLKVRSSEGPRAISVTSIIASVFSSDSIATDLPALPPARPHTLAYHRPLLLDLVGGGPGAQARIDFLKWYDDVKKQRQMPWRQEWINPEAEGVDSNELQENLKQRAYRVWISEVMLQQTRVATVIDYFDRWMKKWPRIEDLAAAKPDEVLAAWKGLGYYSRSARIHEAAKKVVADKDLKGLLPALPEALCKEVPGVGPYTAGAISSIVFGHAVPIVDGNVIRVLSRQMGLMANTKDKATLTLLWETARRLVRRTVLDHHKMFCDAEQLLQVEGTQLLPRSHIPGDLNQALMELGSTICAPKPLCLQCPIQRTCRAFAEGTLLAQGGSEASRSVASLPDMEDLCSICLPAPISDEPTRPRSKKPETSSMKQSKLSFGSKRNESESAAPDPHKDVLDPVIESYVKLMPPKVEKGKVKEEHCAVCIIQEVGQKGDSEPTKFLLEQRPSKGLLANMWQFPTLSFGHADPPSAPLRASQAKDFVTAVALKQPPPKAGIRFKLSSCKPLGAIQHVFSHLILNMHIYVFEIRHQAKQQLQGSTIATEMPRKWCAADAVAAANMGTGMVNVFEKFRASMA